MVSHCRQDIIPILSPPLRRRFRPQKPGFHHGAPPLSLIPFLPPKGGSHSLRKYFHWILLVSTILTTPHMSGSVHRRRRYGSCRFFCLLILFPLQIRSISVSSSNHETYRISPDRSLQDEYDYGENVGIGKLVAEKFLNYFPPLEKAWTPLYYC